MEVSGNAEDAGNPGAKREKLHSLRNPDTDVGALHPMYLDFS